MKDEEMAEEYAENYVMREDVITENNRVPFDNGYGFQTVSFENEVKKGYKYGFLAGLKAGRPQWHDLRKDKNDLPVNNKEVLIITSDNRKHIGFYNNGWFCQDSGGIVIAWCEIPTFDKE